jgi:hypothetical protein
METEQRITLAIVHTEVRHIRDSQEDNRAILKEILHALHGTEDSPGLSKKVYSLEQSRDSARKSLGVLYTLVGGMAIAMFTYMLDLFRAH